MDGHFVPPITHGRRWSSRRSPSRSTPPAAARRAPDDRAPRAPRRGVRQGRRRQHHDPRRGHAARALRAAGDPRGRAARAGLALNPATPVAAASEVRRRPRPAAVHDRQPGLGRPGVPASSLGKLERLRALLGPGVALEVDGGIDAATAGPCAEAGATAFVAGIGGVRRAGSGQRVPRDRCRRLPYRGRRDSRTSHPGGYGQPYRQRFHNVTRLVNRGSPGPHRRRPSVVPRHCARPARSRGLRRRRRGRDGASALTEAGRLQPEVVLLDVQLPDIDGFDVAARLTGNDDARS